MLLLRHLLCLALLGAGWGGVGCGVSVTLPRMGLCSRNWNVQ